VNRFLLPLGAFALLVAVLAIGVRRAPDKGTIDSPLIGRPAPRYVLPDLLDPQKPFDSREYAGRWHVVNVWGTWCVGCREEHGVLVDAHRAGSLPIIGLNWKDDDAAALAWLAQLGNPYAAIPTDRDGRVAIDWGVYGAPETFLVDPRGIIVYKHVGPLTPDIWAREFVARAGAGGSGS
jgi:cytochrome c biogenesis protein CcmG/thiol:disulfide interchange protein DsbE